MAQFYGSMTGRAATTATRCGDKNSGVNAHIRGWKCGAEVDAIDSDGADQIDVYMTGGSAAHGGLCGTFLLSIVDGPNGPSIIDISPELREAAQRLS